MVDRLRDLRADEKRKAGLLGYFDAVWAPGIRNTRIIHARLHALGTAWRERTDRLAKPEGLEQPGARPKEPDLNAFEQSEAQHRRNMDNAVRAFNRLERQDVAGDGPQAIAAWQRVGTASAKFFAAEAALQERREAYQRTLSVWEAKHEAWQPMTRYFSDVAARRRELEALIERYNALVEYDSPVTARSTFVGQYTRFVPSHHFYLPNTGEGPMYFYVYEQNQMDMHFHLADRDPEADVVLVTFKKWGAARHTDPAGRGDDYFPGGGLDTSRRTVLEALVRHMRTTYPTTREGTPQRIAPPLPRHRHAV